MAVDVLDPAGLEGISMTATIVRKEEIPRADAGTSEADRIYRFNLQQVDRMVETGILPEGAPLELLDGLLVRKMTKGDPHVLCLYLAMDALNAVLRRGWFVRKEDPIVLPEGPFEMPSLPEPDLAVVRGTYRDYAHRKPQPGDVGLLIEVADTSLRKDRAALKRFAWAKIPTVWIVNLQARNVEVYTDPSGPGEDTRYASCRSVGEAGEIPVILDGAEIGRIAVAGILP